MNEKYCATCKWHQVDDVYVCANDRCVYYGDWTGYTGYDFVCEMWEDEGDG